MNTLPNAPLGVSPIAELAHTLTIPARQGAAAAVLGLADISLTPRFGCKGPGAAAWLAAQGLPLPSLANSWLMLPNGGLIARLGNTEYLVEGAAELINKLAAQSPGHGVYPVLRQDLALVLGGERLPELLRQVCSVNFAAFDLNAAPVVITSMVGVGVTVIPGPRYRLWCDGSYGHYLWETLLGIAQELGGGGVDASHLN